MSSSTQKEALIAHCIDKIQVRKDLLNEQLKMNHESRDADSKSSMGDKYETSKAMLHIEEEKIRKQLAECDVQLSILNKINLNQQNTHVTIGSLVVTNKGKYFISVPLAQLQLGSELFFCITDQSPIGKLLMGKKQNETIEFNRIKQQIIEVI